MECQCYYWRKPGHCISNDMYLCFCLRGLGIKAFSNGITEPYGCKFVFICFVNCLVEDKDAGAK
ncbi:hypothetical protein SLEP1_g15747 [Rubroshorea leprosula]|uniref:Uncharacterized protein n=1 Tax=Rubroshorea leprosula TaxID=152421 RepID=A0AAV5IXU6_9ROSI|nr:hypothetical protein SLEP1_g15747 [Rubroshorea leprosula]